MKNVNPRQQYSLRDPEKKKEGRGREKRRGKEEEEEVEERGVRGGRRGGGRRARRGSSSSRQKYRKEQPWSNVQSKYLLLSKVEKNVTDEVPQRCCK